MVNRQGHSQAVTNELRSQQGWYEDGLGGLKEQKEDHCVCDSECGY